MIRITVDIRFFSLFDTLFYCSEGQRHKHIWRESRSHKICTSLLAKNTLIQIVDFFLYAFQI